MSKFSGADIKNNHRTDWADDEDDDTPDLPPPQKSRNKDGTETIVSYRIDEAGRKLKLTQRIARTKVRHVVYPHVAERKQWAKFGKEKGNVSGIRTETTTLVEIIPFRPNVGYKAGGANDECSITAQKKSALKGTKITCRICKDEHWTSRCPYKDTMNPEDPEGGAGSDEATGRNDDEPSGGASGSAQTSYVPPPLRKGGSGSGDRGGGKYERDDLATLRVTNVSEFAEESDLRDMFSRFGKVNRVFLAKDRETGRAKGFAFVSFDLRPDAMRAREKLDGYGYRHLILRVELAKKST